MPLEKLPAPLNTDAFNEGGPVISMDGRLMYFTRSGSPDFERTLIKDGDDVWVSHPEEEYQQILGQIYREISNQEVPEPYLSQFNQDIWIAHLNGDSIAAMTHPGFPINNALPNSVLSARLDSQKLVVINQFYSDGSMYEGFSSVTGTVGGNFGFPQPMHIYNFYNISTDVNLALSTRGQVMILSLERHDSYGGKDLYVSFKISDNLWSEPQNLGATLNTPDTETTPFISDDNRHLYFATDRPGTIGGLDIWMSERLDYTWLHWTVPRPVDLPLNSAADDLQPYVDHVNSNFYFVSRRDGTSDIFRQPLRPMPRLKAPIRIRGLILDGVTLQPLRAELFHGPADTRDYLEYMHTFTGEFQYELTEYGVYKFLARKPGYGDARLMFDTRLAEQADLPVHEVILYLYRDATNPTGDPLPLVRTPEDPAPRTSADLQQATATPVQRNLIPAGEPQVGDKMTFFNIYFAQGKADILPTSREALDDLYRILERYPNISIRIEGHTDNVAPPGFEYKLMELSWERAQAVKEEMTRRGINPGRINTIGLGDTVPVADNRTEQGREKNRRVEIQVIGQ